MTNDVKFLWIQRISKGEPQTILRDVTFERQRAQRLLAVYLIVRDMRTYGVTGEQASGTFNRKGWGLFPCGHAPCRKGTVMSNQLNGTERT